MIRLVWKAISGRSLRHVSTSASIVSISSKVSCASKEKLLFQKESMISQSGTDQERHFSLRNLDGPSLVARADAVSDMENLPINYLHPYLFKLAVIAVISLLSVLRYL
jgi:hypothetical protein